MKLQERLLRFIWPFSRYYRLLDYNVELHNNVERLTNEKYQLEERMLILRKEIRRCEDNRAELLGISVYRGHV
jgi:hypothetical protein